MKNITLIFFLVIITGTPTFSQSFSLADDAGPLANGTDVFQSGPSDTLQLITWLHLTNTNGNALRVMMKKQEISMLSGGSSSICWAGYCFGPEMMVSSFSLEMAAGETVSGCFGHFGPNGCRGVSIVRWAFFNEADPSDSISITVHYSTYPTAAESQVMPVFSLTMAGMAPARDQIILRHSLPPGKVGTIELRSGTGKLVSTSEKVVLSGTVIFKVSEISSGLYFCTLVVDGKPCLTKKTIIYH